MSFKSFEKGPNIFNLLSEKVREEPIVLSLPSCKFTSTLAKKGFLKGPRDAGVEERFAF